MLHLYYIRFSFPSVVKKNESVWKAFLTYVLTDSITFFENLNRCPLYWYATSTGIDKNRLVLWWYQFRIEIKFQCDNHNYWNRHKKPIFRKTWHKYFQLHFSYINKANDNIYYIYLCEPKGQSFYFYSHGSTVAVDCLNVVFI